MRYQGATSSNTEQLPAWEIARLFADLFELDDVALDDDFFRLGGDSLLATQLTIGIEQRFGVALSPSVLIEASTPLALAGALGATGEQPSLMLVARAGSGSPLYCVHGIDGASLVSGRIAGALRTANPVFGFRAQGLEAGEQPLTTIEAMARRYLEAMDLPNVSAAPCLLLGHCGGAMIAYEMAQQLIKRGRPVDGLILIDPEVDGRAPFLHRSGWRLMIDYLKFARRARRFNRRVRKAKGIGREKRPGLVTAAMNLAVARYRPKPLDCPTLFICTRTRRSRLLDPQRGYQTLLTNAQIVKVDLHHRELFADGLEEIVGLIEHFLRHLQQPSDGAAG